MSNIESVRQTGEVVAAEGELVHVRFKRSEACGHCNACFNTGSDEAEITIHNTMHAGIGDTVEIEMHGKSVLKASLILYGFPVLALVLGVMLGSLISDIGGAVGGVVLCVAALLVIRAFEPKFRRMSEFKPRMIRVVGRAAE